MRDNLFSFTLKKILEVSLALVCLVTLTFLLLRFLPGGPFDHEAAPHPVVREALEKSWNLQESWWHQYRGYMKSLAQGDLGVSLNKPGVSVVQVISQGLQQTLWLNLSALICVYLFAFMMCFGWASCYGSRGAVVIEQILLGLISLPSLFLAPLLIYVFGIYFNIFPIAFLHTPWHFVLPLVALTLRPMAYLSRLLLRSLKEQMDADYARTAKAKGLSPQQIFYRHVLRNSLIPALSYSGNLIVSLVSGSFLVEMLFSIPGLGSEFISSLAERDYTVICGLALFYGALLIVLNMVLDIVMRSVDPRLKEAG